MKFARGREATTTLHIIAPTWSQEYDRPDLHVLCRTDDWCITDDPVGRDDLLCGRCVDVWHAICDELERPTPITKNLNYEEYSKTEHWQHMREIAREHYGDCCCLCGSTVSLDVHHRTYDRRGRERLSDVILLCRDCHATYHKRAS